MTPLPSMQAPSRSLGSLRLSEEREAKIRRITSIKTFGAVCVNDGGDVAFVISRPAASCLSEPEAELCLAQRGTLPRYERLTDAAGHTPLAWSAADCTLAFVAERSFGRSQLCFYEPGSGQSRTVASVPGTIEQMAWSADRQELLLLVFEAAGDPPASIGADESSSRIDRPTVTNPESGRRQLVLVNAISGQLRRVELAATVWEMCWGGGGTATALTSRDPSENGWYRSELTIIDLRSGAASVVHRPEVQMAALALSPDGRRVAFVEGLSSDRGMASGQPKLLDLHDRRVSAPGSSDDVAWLGWADDSTLIYTGWSGLGTKVGTLTLDGEDQTIWTGAKTLGPRFRPKLATGGGLAAGVLEADGVPPELFTLGLDNAGPGWSQVTTINAADSFDDRLVVQEVAWKSADGVEIQGLLWRPREVQALPALVVLVHGGPTLAWTHSYAPSFGLAAALVAAGFSVLLPNPRGSAGRGAQFKAANLKDLGGRDFDDIVVGAEWCRQKLFPGAPVPVGIVGHSYGGYLSCWAAATHRCFTAAIGISPVSDWVSELYASGGGEWVSVFLESADPHPSELYRSRSPITHVDHHSLPTLLLHGEADSACPVGQGAEFYGALRRAGVSTELVVYPNEEHDFVGTNNQIDLLRRSIGWFQHHLAGKSPPGDLR